LSADLNAIEDCIVGAKHPALIVPVGAPAFKSKNGAVPVNGQDWSLTAVEQLYYSLPLIPGTRLVEATFYYLLAGGSGGATMKVRKATQGGAWVDLATFTDTTSTTNQQKVLAAINEVGVAGTQYQLYFDNGPGGAGATRLDFASYKIDRL
jgi:hypothetical protein